MKTIKLLKKTMMLSSLFFGTGLVASQVDLLGGAYQIDATTSEGSVSLKNVGLAKFNYYLRLRENISFRPGYSLYVLKGKDADLGYGFDFSFLYYPLTRISSFTIDNNSVKWVHREVFRPYVGLSFHQRQYQSIQSNYAGIGICAGLEYRPGAFLPDSMHVTTEVNLIGLDGPLSAKITETQATIGLGSTF